MADITIAENADTKDDILKALATDDVADDKSTKDDDVVADKDIDAGDENDSEDSEDPNEKNEEIDIKDGEDEEVKEEDLDEIPSVKFADVKKKYPEITKEFPWLKNVVYRERAYTEILPTVEDAREAVAKSEVLDNFEVDLRAGDTSKLLTNLKIHDPEGFAKTVDNYLTNIGKADINAYYVIVGNVIKEAIIGMMQEARDNDRDDLKGAAEIINEFIFNSKKFEAPIRLSKRNVSENSESDKIKKEREEFHNEKFTSTKTDVLTRVDNRIKSTIDTHIDPKNSMTPYVKSKATADALADLKSRMAGDKRFNITVDKLWDQAKKDKYSKVVMDKITTAYISAARALLSPVIQKTRAEALRGSNRSNSSTTKVETTRRSASSSNSGNKPKDIPKGMSTREFLDQD